MANHGVSGRKVGDEAAVQDGYRSAGRKLLARYRCATIAASASGNVDGVGGTRHTKKR